MTPGEIEAALQAAIARCDAVNCPLNPQQRQILLQVVLESLYKERRLNSNRQEWGDMNPLDEFAIALVYPGSIASNHLILKNT